MRRNILTSLFLAFLIIVGLEAYGQTRTLTLNTPGSGNFTIPYNISTIEVQVWGGGGGGGYNSASNRPAAGGGGGGFSSHPLLPVTPSTNINYTVGNGGLGGTPSIVSTDGSLSIFGSITANGGRRGNELIGGTGGAGSGGSLNFSGGNSNNAPNSNNRGGSGGGGAGGPGGAGNPGLAALSTLGGIGGTSIGGGAGGNGGDSGNSGSEGNQPGGGGGGEGTGNGNGGNGGNGRIILNWACNSSLVSGNPNPAPICLGTGIGTITYNLTGATGYNINWSPSVPSGINVTTDPIAGTVSIQGNPSSTGTFSYTLTPTYPSGSTGGCTGPSSFSGSFIVNANNTAGTISSNIFCQGSPLPAGVTQPTTGATGIGAISWTPSNPGGITASWASNQITFSGTPATSGTFNYSIPLTGGCGNINATGTITINATPAITAQNTPGGVTCINGTPFGQLSVGTGFGYTYQWYSNDTQDYTTPNLISGATSNTYTPPNNISGTSYYYVVVNSPTCSSVTSSVSGAYIVNPNNTVSPASSSPTVCVSTAIPTITHSVTGGTGLGTITWSPSNPGGITASLNSGIISINGTPTNFGVFSYSIPVTGGCGIVNATGTIIVNAQAAIISPSLTGQTRCENAAFSPISVANRQGFTYQWFENTANNNSSGTAIAGATSNSYTPPSTPGPTKYYYVRVTSSACSTTATSAASGPFVVNSLPIVSFVGQPTPGNYCVDTNISYSTQPGETNYVWTIPGTVNVDYTIVSGGNGNPNLVLRWLTPGNKSVTVNYQDAQGCGATTPAISNTITIQKNFASPPSNPNPSSCNPVVGGGIFPTITHNTTGATGISNAGISGANGLPLGLSATWSGTATNGTITISGTVDPSVTPGPKSYSIPLTGGCGTVAATGVIDIQPQYTITEISSVSPSNLGGAATVTLKVNPASFANGPFVINYQRGLANPLAANNITVNFTNGVATFFSPGINNADLTSLTINSIRKDTDPTSCPITLTSNNNTFFGIQPKIFDSNGTFYVPAGIFQVTVKVYGAGGGGGGGNLSSNSAGGGGGGYSERTINVIPGEPLGIFVGAGGAGQINPGTPAGNGGNSWVTRDSSHPNPQASSVAYAFGGGGANGTTRGAAALPGLNGTINQPGNIGALPNTTAPDTGGRGGKGGGPDGGNGGLGGAGAGNRPGDPGIPFGGGGGGAKGNANGGNGAGGYVIITYPLPQVSSCFKVIDDGAISGTTVIEFTCNTSWTAPEGLAGFSAVVGGAGGGGGYGSGSGGGGAGQLVQNLSYTTTNPYGLPAGTTFSITVGQGGQGAANINEKGGIGLPSSITGTIDGSPISGAFALGGGGGGSRGNGLGTSGASGGGGAASSPPVTIFQGGAPSNTSIGKAGGTGDASTNGAHAGGGGGGIFSLGQTGQGAGTGQGKGGDGGNGIQFVIAGVTRNFGAGGGGIGNNFNGVNKFNGLGGKVVNSAGQVVDVKIGGDGNQDNASSIGLQGLDRTGSGGGAGFAGGGRGGNGVVYIYYFNFRILEVEYLYFETTYLKSDKKGLLKWATSKEWENSHFEIERSINGVDNWKKIGSVKGQGYSNDPFEYQFSDENLPPSGGIIYYRLKQFDFDGKFTYSKVKSIQVEPVSGSSYWVTYPNPSSRNEQIKLTLLNTSVYNDEPIIIRISDAKGVTETYTVRSPEDVSEKVNFHLRAIDQGVFVVQLIWGNHQQQIKLIRI